MMAKKKPYALGVVLVHYVKRGRIQLDSKMYPASLVGRITFNPWQLVIDPSQSQ